MKYTYIFLIIALIIQGCKKEETQLSLDDNRSTCDTTFTPIIMVHGFLASGDTWEKQKMRFTSNGYCPNFVRAFDWNSLNQGGNNVALLDSFINKVLLETGKSKVNLVGHSAGGGLGYQYLNDPARAAKVSYYVHVASSAQTNAAGPNGEIPTLNLWSTSDEVGQAGSINGATNVMIPGLDHYQVATSVESFSEMYKFFNNNQNPQTTNITPMTNIGLCGRVVTLGENSPIAGASIQVYKVNPSTGERLSSTPDFTTTSDANGDFGSIHPEPGAKYEFFVVTNKPGDRPIHYYREGFTHNDLLVYLRTLPPSNTTAGTLLNTLPKNDNQSVAVVFTSSQAVVNTRDSLFVDNNELSSAQISPASSTNIALFMFDSNNNNQTDMTQPFLFTFTPFLEAADIYFQTTTPAQIDCRFNGRTLKMRNWKSESEGITIAVFD